MCKARVLEMEKVQRSRSKLGRKKKKVGDETCLDQVMRHKAVDTILGNKLCIDLKIILQHVYIHVFPPIRQTRHSN